MKTIISGPRHIPHERAKELVREALAACPWAACITSIVHGDARGVDRAAGEVCDGRWLVEKEPAKWDELGKAAGPIRNKTMALYSQALIAVWDGASPGTKNMIEVARAEGLRVFTYLIDKKTQKHNKNSGFGLA